MAVDGTSPSPSAAAAAAVAAEQRDAAINGGISNGTLAGAPAAAGSFPSPQSKLQVVRIEVLGDDKVGKTSLICSLVSRHFSDRVPGVLLNVQIPAEENNENVIISITDTSSRVSDIVRVANATKRSDAILLVYDLTRPETIQRLRRWLDLIARHKEVPVVLVGNKDDIKTVVTTSTMMDGLHSSQIRQLVNTYQFAVDGGDCSARNFAQVARAFYCAQKAVLYPVEPLYNAKKRVLEPKCIKAIKRTFRLYDRDRDGLLNREELNEYQYDCFGMRLLAAEMDTMMEFLQSTIPEGVKEDGSAVRFAGFVFLWQLFIDRKRPESCWQVLRCLGYTNDLKLEIPADRIALPAHEEDQSAQLTPYAIEVLDGLFRQYDGDKDGNLVEDEIDEIFSICEDEEAPWRNCSAISTPILFTTTLVADKLVLSRAAWLALWSFVAQENPEKLLETFYYLGYNDKNFGVIEYAKGRSTTRQSSRIERSVVTCYVYAPSASLKTRFANSLVGRKNVASSNYSQPLTTNDLVDENDLDPQIIRAINAVQNKDASTTYLLLTEELADGEVDKHADVLCFLFDPLQTESLESVKAMDAKLSSAIPRVYLGLKSDDAVPVAAEWEEITRHVGKTNSMVLVEDDRTKTEAFEKLVRTALRPPNARAHRKRSGSFVLVMVGSLAMATMVGGLTAMTLPESIDLLGKTLLAVRDLATHSHRA